MSTHAGPAADDPARQFVHKLKEARRSCEGRPEGEMRSTLQQALRAELAGLSEADAARRLDGAREMLIGEARSREQRLERVEAQLRSLMTEAEALRAERDRLAAAGSTGRTSAAPQPASSSSSPLSEGLEPEEALSVVREGLREITLGKKVAAESLGLRPGGDRLFRLFTELLLFALNFETGVHGLLTEIEVGPAMDSMLRVQQKKIIQSRFRACLDDEPGSIQALKDALARNSRFLLELHAAYTSAINQGTQAILDTVDPQPIQDESRGMMGIDKDRAWKTYRNLHTDLINLAPSDIWDRFFQKPFKDRLGDYLSVDEQAD